MYASERIDRILATVHADESSWTDNPAELPKLQREVAACRDYLRGHAWCTAVADIRLGLGIAGLVTVCLATVEGGPNIDHWLWVVGGDVPTAYLVVDETAHPIDALLVYVELMAEWADAVLRGSPLDDCFPVDAPADARHARDLMGSALVPSRRLDPRAQRGRLSDQGDVRPPSVVMSA